MDQNLARVRRRRRWWAVLVVLFGLTTPVVYAVMPSYLGYLRFEPRDGDIIFQSLPHMPLINAIEGATQSPYSHCGIVAQEQGRWYVYEALNRVRRVSLLRFCLQGRGDRFIVYRLREEDQKYVPDMLRYVRSVQGRPYDMRYEMDDEKIYCSELIYKAYQSAAHQPLGQTVRFGDLDWKPYEQLVVQLERGTVPVDRVMIPPRQLSEAKQLRPVYNFGYDQVTVEPAKN
jgi:hypothetical protein